MLKKLFGNKEDPRSEKPDWAHLERLLAEIVRETPQIDWIVLIKSDEDVSVVPAEMGTDRISAMGAAMSALGERIASELKDGELQYILIAGTNEISMTIELSPDCLLVIGLDKDASIEKFLSRMQETSLPLLRNALHIEGTLQLSGIQQK